MSYFRKRHSVSRTVEQLKKIRRECVEDELSTECAVLTAMIAAVRFEEGFRNGSYQQWAGMFGVLAREIRNMEHALDLEFADANVIRPKSTDHGATTPGGAGEAGTQAGEEARDGEALGEVPRADSKCSDTEEGPADQTARTILGGGSGLLDRPH